MLGTRFFATGELIDLAENHGTVGVAVEYRMAPEHPLRPLLKTAMRLCSGWQNILGPLSIDPNASLSQEVLQEAA